MLTKDDIISAALDLPLETRVDIIHQLLDSVKNGESTSYTREWIQEIESRIRAHEEGRLGSIPGEIVFNEIRTKYQA